MDSEKLRIIDCDIHNPPPSYDQIKPYLSDYWQEYTTQSDFKGPPRDLYAAGLRTYNQNEQNGATNPLDVTLDTMRQQLLDPLDIQCAILNCAYAVESLHNPYGAAALAAAVNDWQLDAWLKPEPRLRASLVVPSQDPELSVKEIERLGADPGFVQVYLPVRSAELYGTRRFHPIYRAASQHNLVINIHAGGAPGAPPSSSGWPSYYVEEYANFSPIFQSQLINMIVEGVFEEFPALKVVFSASGFTWLPSLMWRLDKEWKGLRREIPWVKRPPSEYIYEHVRFTLQPLDAPPTNTELEQIIGQAGSDALLLFSTDYGYTHFGSVDEALPPNLSADFKRKLLSENALATYHIELP